MSPKVTRIKKKDLVIKAKSLNIENLEKMSITDLENAVNNATYRRIHKARS